MNSARPNSPGTQGTRFSEIGHFWGVEACGSHFTSAPRGTPEFYEEYTKFRYMVEWHIPLLVPFADTEGKKVLEIGCGNGADGAMFARAGADYVGVDLTSTAVEATRTHFSVLGLDGRFQTENAENLSFGDECFDFVYSHGALHHTSNPSKAFSEVHRVLKPGGKAILMLYNKRSFNYYLRILGYMRAKVLFRIVSRLGRFSTDRTQLNGALTGIRGNQTDSVLQIHYENFLRDGWPYLRARNFVHHATDGPECPFAFVYSSRTLQNLLGQFRSIETKVAHFPLRKYSVGKFVPFAVERWLASRLGWYLFVYLTK